MYCLSGDSNLFCCKLLSFVSSLLGSTLLVMELVLKQKLIFLLMLALGIYGSYWFTTYRALEFGFGIIYAIAIILFEIMVYPWFYENAKEELPYRLVESTRILLGTVVALLFFAEFWVIVLH